MESLKLHTSPSARFSGFYTELADARYVVLGVPYDHTSTYRSGSRFGPAAIREASQNIETYSIRTGIDLEKIPICDVGDLHVVGDLDETLRRLERVVGDILAARKIPVMLGGEHTMTLGVIRALGRGVGVVSFDAHGDLRDEYSGLKTMHATFMRRVSEIVDPDHIVEIGLRALCAEEVEFLKSTRLRHLTSQELMKQNAERALGAVKKLVRKLKRVYLTVDVDVFDPAFAPGVGSPEAEGLSPTHFFSMLSAVVERPLVGFDVVETAPDFDKGGATAVLAARVVFEAISGIEANKRRQ